MKLLSLIACAVRTILPFLLAGTAWSKTLTVAEWNLKWFPGRSPRPTAEGQQRQMEAAQNVLRELNPDILLAEEVGDWQSFEKLVSVVPKLQVDTVSTFRQGRSIGRQQEAIASDLPANSTWSEEWKKSNANPPRGLAFAALTLPDGKILFVYAVHLKSNAASAIGCVCDWARTPCVLPSSTFRRPGLRPRTVVVALLCPDASMGRRDI